MKSENIQEFTSQSQSTYNGQSLINRRKLNEQTKNHTDVSCESQNSPSITWRKLDSVLYAENISNFKKNLKFSSLHLNN